MCELLASAAQAGRSDAKVLITGESGTGKELIAGHVHANSPRARQNLVTVNCAAYSEMLLESELFGHEKGSFTGAHRDKLGQLELAHRGTLFLDEVGDMSLRMQALLLRFLENGEIQTVGGQGPKRGLDVRIIAATNRDLRARVAAGEFREDLLYRLDVISLHVPPLRQRPDDIEALVLHFLHRSPRQLMASPEALDILRLYHWPGNVRQLQNVVEQASWMCQEAVISPEHLPQAVRGARLERRFRERRRQLANDLFDALTTGGYTFFEHVYPLFLQRDITRHDLRELLKLGLARTAGNYRALVPLFGIATDDYKKFLNFLQHHELTVDYHPFRKGQTVPPEAPPKLLRSRPDGGEPII
jgi:transcriptional regulator with PAS, ATPase and Fis domain